MGTTYNQNLITIFEKQQMDQINKWKNEEPSVVNQAFEVALKPVSWLVEKVIPEKAIKGLLEGANEAGRFLADTNDIIRDGQVSKIQNLKYKDLKLSDELADEVHNWAIGIAAAEGGIAGYFGLPGTVEGGTPLPVH
ncbi:MAG: EcsC family protein [Neobacillus sp.]|nr:EcsC family protein [Neobacillus sp.]